jgi:hypothetical protein
VIFNAYVVPNGAQIPMHIVGKQEMAH